MKKHTNPCLQTLIEKALEGNTDLRIASMKTVEASAQLKLYHSLGGGIS